jgi:hypothetical protein
VNLGDTFLNINPYIAQHLWAIVSNPATDGRVVMFNFTSRHPGCEETCIIRRGEHPFVKHDTIVAYQRGQWLSRADWDQLQKLGFCQPHSSLTPSLLLRIQRGALDCDLTPIGFLEIIRASMS